MQKKEILDRVGNMVDMVGTLYDEREKLKGNLLTCSRDLKETENELIDKNFRIAKALTLLKNNIGNNSMELRIEAINILEGKYE